MTLTEKTPVGTIAKEYPLATRVFARHKIDFCCGGGKPLDEVCQQKDLDWHQILSELESEIAGGDPVGSWEDRPVNDLVHHILETYHAPLHEELPRLQAMAKKVKEVHGAGNPGLTELDNIVQRFAQELKMHMHKEEQVLFPAILAGQGAMFTCALTQMRHEHDEAGNELREIRRLTNDFVVPEGACNTWRALWVGLEALERDMHEHVHLENNVLFPKIEALTMSSV